MKIEKVLIKKHNDEVVEICVSPETFKKIEKEVEKIVISHKKLYGQIYPSYKNLIKEIIIKLDE